MSSVCVCMCVSDICRYMYLCLYICGVCMCVCIYLYVVYVCRWMSCSVYTYVCLCAYLGSREIVYSGMMSSIVCVLVLQYVFLRVVCVSDRWVLCGTCAYIPVDLWYMCI